MQIYANLCKFYANLCKFMQICANLCKFMLIYANLRKFMQIYAKFFLGGASPPKPPSTRLGCASQPSPRKEVGLWRSWFVKKLICEEVAGDGPSLKDFSYTLILDWLIGCKKIGVDLKKKKMHMINLILHMFCVCILIRLINLRTTFTDNLHIWFCIHEKFAYCICIQDTLHIDPSSSGCMGVFWSRFSALWKQHVCDTYVCMNR